MIDPIKMIVAKTFKLAMITVFVVTTSTILPKGLNIVAVLMILWMIYTEYLATRAGFLYPAAQLCMIVGMIMLKEVSMWALVGVILLFLVNEFVSVLHIGILNDEEDKKQKNSKMAILEDGKVRSINM